MILYANDNNGHFPRTTFASSGEAKPVWGTGAPAKDPFAAGGVQPNDVSAEWFLIARTQDATSDIFVCPSSNHEKDLYDGAKAPVERGNFTDVKKNLSYSIQNAYPKDGVLKADDTTWWTKAMKSPDEFAIAADINPGTSPSSADDVLKPTASSTQKEMKLANSNNHDKDGQNILYGDGHVAFESNPFVGVNRDNVYTTADGKIAASPVDANDSILLPTDD
jgi:prepilin-type processing-associated H-X9-DG protein